MQVGRERELRSLVPHTKPMPLIGEASVSSEARAMMTDKIEIVKLRKNLRPNNPRYFVKDIVLPFYERCCMAEFAFYFDEMLYSLSITLRTALKF